MGESTEERVKADGGSQQISKVRGLLAALANNLATSQDQDFIKKLEPNIARIKNDIKAVGDYSMGVASEQAIASLSKLEVMAKDGPNGSAWDGGKEYTDEAEMMVDAEQTLGKLNPTSLAVLISDLQTQQQKYEATATRFDSPLDVGLNSKFLDTINEAKLTKNAALIFYALTKLSSNPVSLKRTIRAAVAELNLIAKSELLQPLLQTLIEPHTKKMKLST